ncbi:AbrB/MazE/SpoVT family DNA-binding domain-containing protein [Candidatus Woesearchaeota archaeon]|nr:AbrB/MazE/SpoVT family DNA-binding domain-containing protein [Candidatus Woesearchaeota archaeon]
MEILNYERNVHRIGLSYLLTLPKDWCRKHGVSSDTKLSVSLQHDGQLLVSVKNDPTDETRQ